MNLYPERYSFHGMDKNSLLRLWLYIDWVYI